VTIAADVDVKESTKRENDGTKNPNGIEEDDRALNRRENPSEIDSGDHALGHLKK
jgi:hypothetical protein